MAVISLSTYKQLKNSSDALLAYKARLLQCDKLDLLEEMVVFQTNRAKVGFLTIDMIKQGQILFELLEKSAETEELKLLTRSYRRHLEYEYNALMNIKPEPIA